MQLVQEGMNDEEAIEKAAVTLEFDQNFSGSDVVERVPVSTQ